MNGLTRQKFARLFAGRTDAYGTDAGGCERTTTTDPQDYERRIAAHLVGSNPMGVYPLRDDGTVWWGCTDLDGGDADWPKALGIATALRALGVNAHIERSRSKGFHVWSFAAEPVPGGTMRNAFVAVHQALGIPATEVNPKQTELNGGLGNYVRLPYVAATVEERDRQVMVSDDNTPLTFRPWVYGAHADRSPASAYGAIEDTYYQVPPAPRRVEWSSSVPTVDGTITSRLNKQGYLAWRYGPTEGHDRSSSLMRLAYLGAESGLQPAETLAVIRDLDDRLLHKFTDREDGEQQLMKMVERAYQ